MNADRVEAVSALLRQAEDAHGTYESTELHGVYDRDWPRWYAAYAVDHGLAQILGRTVTPDDLAGSLASGFDEFQAADPTPAESWDAFIARRIVAERRPR
jgi:hypothetical protein